RRASPRGGWPSARPATRPRSPAAPTSGAACRRAPPGRRTRRTRWTPRSTSSAAPTGRSWRAPPDGVALRPPPGHAPTRFLVRFPDEAAADEVRSRGGARLTLVLEDGTEVPAVVVGSSGATLRAEADRSLAGTPLRVGAEVTVSWAELDDLASVGGTLGSG